MNFNTFLIAIGIAVAGWVGTETSKSAKKIAAIEATINSFQALKALENQQISDIKKSLEKLDTKLGDTVTRSEFQHRLEGVEDRLKNIEGKFKTTK